MLVYIALEIVVVLFILVLLRVIITKKETKFLSRCYSVLLALQVILLFIEYFMHSKMGINWGLDSSAIEGIYLYTQLFAIILWAVYWYVVQKMRKSKIDG